MLEPLIVLTVLNCFFMFSSTVTTCALWWQYRSHRCCFKRDSTSKHDLSRLKISHPIKSLKRNGNGRQNSVANEIVSNKSNLNFRHNRSSRRKQRSKSNVRYLLQDRTLSDEEPSSMDLEEKTRMPEASQTANDTKSAVVMEYSTVQKIIQIIDDDVDLTATRMAIREMNAKQNNEEKKLDQCTEIKDQVEPITKYEQRAEE